MYRFILSSQGPRSVGIVLKSERLIANCLPTVNPNVAATFLERIAKRLGINSQLEKIDHPVSSVLFDLDTKPKEHYSVSQSISIDFELFTPKQQQVMEALRRTTPGSKVSYKQLANLVNIPDGARFVGNCMAKNTMPLIIPCHRVIKSDGSMGNYSAEGGVEKKAEYLRKES